MNDLLGFFTSQEILVVYMVIGLASFLCIIIYIVEKNNVKIRQRHNTKELKKLVSQIKEEVEIPDEPEVIYKEPVLEVVPDNEEITSIHEVIDRSLPELEPVKVEKPVVEEVKEEPLDLDPIEIVPEEELEYTSIEPDQATARYELDHLEETLQRREEEIEKVFENSTLTHYEEEQEENAIISLEELTRKSKEMEDANELTQYADEGNEPISIQEFEHQVGRNAAPVDGNFDLEEVQKALPKVPEVVPEVVEKPIAQKVQLPAAEPKKFHSSPIISPIFGIERQEDRNDIQLENTANYDKLDAEVQRTNEFLMTLKDLQQKLD